MTFLSEWPDSWVYLSDATWSSNHRFVLRFTVRSQRRGPVVGRWSIRATGVREFSIRDADGGGLQLSGGLHPVLRQYTDSVAALRLESSVVDVAAVVGDLWAAHVALVDDWIHPERYLGQPRELQARLAKRRRTVCRGPAFLVRHYARTLARRGQAVSVASSTQRRPARSRPRLLHFGSSFVVANSFTSERAG
jgi:hypothetical protein